MVGEATEMRSSGLAAVAQKRYADAIEDLSTCVRNGDTELLLALAFAYLQTNDLNRCFLGAELADGERYNTLEHRRARELDALLGP